jgi:hypothetical protein
LFVSLRRLIFWDCDGGDGEFEVLSVSEF